MLSKWLMQFSRASFFTSASTTYQGACLMSVWANMASLAFEYSTQRFRDSRSIGDSFQRFVRSCDAALEPALLFFVADRKPIFDQDDARSHEHTLELGATAKKLLILVVRAKPHHPLDAGAIVPRPVEENHFSCGGKMRNIALEIPLGSFALGRRAQCNHMTYSWIEALGDPFDDAALAGRVSALEKNDDLQPLCLDPLLEFYELNLKLGQFGFVFLRLDPSLRNRSFVARWSALPRLLRWVP